ncbi:response regulator [Paenibacillus thermoaerophilus]|uniref:Response regulator n=1 Tax=Paenibacillus thermoaerophilus TaxID=1215385 RepID=A0ABW2UZ59_9BACL|nr:response regulator [Paenibacillus thermoaerophilus]TMV17466.1 response regulator [Paenibacillus thermoaerophilus]
MIEILLVDDESYVTDSLKSTIPWEQLGISAVYAADSASQAIDILTEQSVDIVVTDIRMPGMDGLELIKRIADSWPHVRCILLTGHSDFEYAKKAIQLQAFDYLLKPVHDEEFVACVTGAIESLKDEWSQSHKYQQLLYNIKSDYSVLRAHLLHDLLLGRRLSAKLLADKLAQYEIPLAVDEPAVMALIQLGKSFSGFDHHSMSLMEFAVGNIAEEIFAGEFAVWHGKAPHDCLLLIAQCRPDVQLRLERSPEYERDRRAMLERSARLFQRQVSNYLKGEISLVVTGWFTFPEGMPSAYRSGLGALFPLGQAESAAIRFLDEERSAEANRSIRFLETLYTPPTLIHLLESKQWEAARDKIGKALSDLPDSRLTREHLYELYLSVANALLYLAHKQGQSIFELNYAGTDGLIDQSLFRSASHLRDWAFGAIERLKRELSANDEHTKRFIVAKVQEMVTSDLGPDTSVKTIAERVYLHPVYLSKVYKAETGESLGDYIIRMRMERALYLLKHTNKRIYEITSELGYQNPQYFSKMFKKHYGLTPGEFREQ